MTAYDRIMYDHFSIAAMRFAMRMSRKSTVVTTMAEPMAHAGLRSDNIIPFEATDLKGPVVRLLGQSVDAYANGCADIPLGGRKHLLAFVGNYMLTGTAKANRHLLLGRHEGSILYHTRHCSCEGTLEFLDDLGKYRNEFGRIKVVVGVESQAGSKYFWASSSDRENLQRACRNREIDVEFFDVSDLYLVPLSDILTYAIRKELRCDFC